MSRLDEPVDRASVLTSARLIRKAHGAERRCCLDCPGAGCPQDLWAQTQLAEHRQPRTPLLAAAD